MAARLRLGCELWFVTMRRRTRRQTAPILDRLVLQILQACELRPLQKHEYHLGGRHLDGSASLRNGYDPAPSRNCLIFAIVLAKLGSTGICDDSVSTIGLEFLCDALETLRVAWDVW